MEHLPLNPEDEIGIETLKIFAKANRFNHWMYQTIEPFCKAPILEIGTGIGNIAQFFIEDQQSIHLSDLREEYCDALKLKYQHCETTVLGVTSIDLVHPNFKEKYKAYQTLFQTVYALNVVEHIDDDFQALENCYDLLQKDGNLIILVPAYNSLFCKLDHALGHFRRYTQKKLSKKIQKAGFEVIHQQYFNLAAMAGWFWYGKILKYTILPEQPIRMYNRLVPLFKCLDCLIANKFGNSVIVVGKKK